MALQNSYFGRWFRHGYQIAWHELKTIFSDGGVLIIFFLGGLLYPLLYNAIYFRGMLEDMPVAVVDQSEGAYSRRFVQKLDATRECAVRYRCADMQEAERLMQQQKVHGIVFIPREFDRQIVRGEQGTISTYADMSSFLYYKGLTMGSSFVMLDEIHQIQLENYAAAGYSGAVGEQLVSPVRSEENLPYNRSFSYTIFFISAALMLVIQQTLFYGSSLLAGTMREQNHSFASLPDRFQGVGVGRIILGRGAAYFLIYLVIGTLVLLLTPWLFHLPQHASFWEILILMIFFIWDCIFFSFTWSTLITRRETVFVLFLFISPICLFLTGFSWPQTAIPTGWKYFSYLFPSTFGCRAFINLNTAGGTLETVAPEIFWMTLQTMCYYVLASVSMYAENLLIKHHDKLIEARKRLAAEHGIDLEEQVYVIGGEEALEEYRKTGRMRRRVRKD